MRLLWRDRWEETPAYAPAPDGLLIAVEASIPLVRIHRAAGRVLRNPGRKVLVFALSDGPSSTYRKAQTKLRERSFSSDYHVVLALGRAGDGRRVLALACRVPRCADFLIAHEQLVRDVEEPFDTRGLTGAAHALKRESPVLAQLGRQRYLYSGDAPPAELLELFERALAVRPAAGDDVLRPPVPAGSADTLLRLRTAEAGGLPVAVLGAGDYVRTEILPTLSSAFARVVVADREPQIVARCAREAGFELATTDAQRAIEQLPQHGIVFVATAHDSHATLAAQALRSGHQVFLEKPPVVTNDDLVALLDAIRETGRNPEVGFNRRYNRLVWNARRLLSTEKGPTTVTCVVREVSVEADHWYLWPNQGTRIAGNLCHWIDMAVFLLGGSRTPVTVSVSPQAGRSAHEIDENRALTVVFDDGSVATFVPTGRGDDTRGVQEWIDARRGNLSLSIDDLWRMTWTREGRTRRRRTVFRDKGHGRMFRDATKRLAAGVPSPYPVDDLIVVSAIQIAATELVRQNELVADVQANVDALRERVTTLAGTTRA